MTATAPNHAELMTRRFIVNGWEYRVIDTTVSKPNGVIYVGLVGLAMAAPELGWYALDKLTPAAPLVPATNTEARQQAELDAEQPEVYNYDARAAGSYKNERWIITVIERTADTVTFKNSCMNGKVSTLPTAEFNHSIGRVMALSQPAAQLFDPIATLPLFSGTAPRVADPGRFDPPARPTDVQAKLF